MNTEERIEARSAKAGQKFDDDKLPLMRGFRAYFPNAMRLVAEVSKFGYDKYGEWGGWLDVPDAGPRYSDALERHLNAIVCGEVVDPESGLPHLAHAAWNVMALLELSERDFDF